MLDIKRVLSKSDYNHRYPMCVSLFKKSADTQSLYIYDISTETLSKLQSETSRTRVHICSSSKEVAERSVPRLSICVILQSDHILGCGLYHGP